MMDEFKETAQASVEFRNARTPREQKDAILMWLRGARLQVSPDERDTDPVDFLIMALEDLNAGHTMRILEKAPMTSLKTTMLEAACGRAMAAVDYLVSRKMPLVEAAAVVEQAIGVKPGAVKRWRETSRSARKLHPAAAAQVQPTLGHWTFLDSLPEGGATSTIISQLIKDRAVHLGG